MNRPIQPDIHPEADSLNAFVERTLPEADHERVLDHLAGCTRCRDIVYLAQQMADVEAAPAPLREATAELRRRWWSPVFVHWRIAWIPTAALAAVAGLLIWVHTRSAERAVQVADTMSPPALSAPPASLATARSVAPPPPEPAVASAEPKRSSAQAAPRQNMSPRNTPRPDLQANQVVLGEMPTAAAPVPAAPPIQSGPALSAPAQRTGKSVLTDTQWQVSQQIQMNPNQAAGAKSAYAPTASGMLAAHGSIMAAQAAAPKPLTAEVLPPVTPYEAMQQPLNGTTALQLTKSLKLPSGRNTVSSAAMLNRLLALDSAGTLYLSVDAGRHWSAVPSQWTGKAVEVRAASAANASPNDLSGTAPAGATTASESSGAESIAAPAPAAGTVAQPSAVEPVPAAPAMLFRLVNDRHRTWISADGKAWREQSP